MNTLLQRVESKKRDIDKRKEAFDSRLCDIKHGRNLTLSSVILEDSTSETSTDVSTMRSDASSSLLADTDSNTTSLIGDASTAGPVIGGDLDKLEDELDLISANLDEVLALTGLKDRDV